MIPNTWSEGLYYSNLCFERNSAEHPSLFHLSPAVDLQDVYFHRSEAGPQVTHCPSRSLGREDKRARVENIIKGMSGPPDFSHANSQEGTSKTFSFHQNQVGLFEMHRLQNQYHFCQQELKNQHGNGTTERKTSKKLERSSFLDMYHEEKPINYTQLKAEKVKMMKDVLKCELSKALSSSVDSIFKTKTEEEEARESSMHHLLPEPAAQTEALSLVVRNEKPHVSEAKHCKNNEMKYDRKSPKNLRERGFEKRQLDLMEGSCCPSKVRAKEDSRMEKGLFTVDHGIKSLPLSRVKHSPGTSRNIYINEGLTTNHLKKAKLMFFYTRYPSSFVLKMCFSDVQFSRCITSQLIKWFSNFREFFYIQMEKVARQLVLQGDTGDTGDAALTVGRESELFRVLNLHYNKTSHFQVPERFLEVSEITLREFYISLCLGRDRDPSWKKSIYRVISKLDSEVPAHFMLTPLF